MGYGTLSQDDCCQKFGDSVVSKCCTAGKFVLIRSSLRWPLVVNDQMYSHPRCWRNQNKFWISIQICCLGFVVVFNVIYFFFITLGYYYYYYYYYFNYALQPFKAYCAIWVRLSNLCHQASPRVSPRTQRRKVELWARNVRKFFLNAYLHVTFRYLLQDGFTSPPKEGVLRIFSPQKSDGFGRVRTRELGYQRPARYL
jgi:hypothetical protein